MKYLVVSYNTYKDPRTGLTRFRFNAWKFGIGNMPMQVTDAVRENFENVSLFDTEQEAEQMMKWRSIQGAVVDTCYLKRSVIDHALTS